MDLGCNWELHRIVYNELTQGMELAKQLRAHLSSTSSSETRELLLQRLLYSYDKALWILKGSGSIGQPQPAAPTRGVPESSISACGSPRSETFLDGGFKDHHENKDVPSKKRKVLPTWTEQVRVWPENWMEVAQDDGYSWRKYGQKDILGTTYPRSYYRCTYRNTQSCWATKQVQRSEEDPTVVDITYKGRHTCNQPPNSVPPLEKQLNHQQQDSNEITSPFYFQTASLGDVKSDENHLFRFSPARSESNYFAATPSHLNSFGRVHNLQHSEFDLTEIISANASAINSPIVDLDIATGPVNVHPNFPFDTPGFFA